MYFQLQPSFKDICAVKVAIYLYFDNKIQKMLRDLEKLSPSELGVFDRVAYKHWRRIEKLVMKKLNFLPQYLPYTVARLIRPIHLEVITWQMHHYFIGDQGREVSLESIFCWKTDGRIDRIKTAQKFVQDESFDLKLRFIMACTYFMENEILCMWQKVKETPSCRCFLKVHSSTRFWLTYIKKGVNKPLSQCISEYFENTVVDKKDCTIRLSSIFSLLSRKKRLLYLKRLSLNIDPDDFLCCLRQMDQKEVSQLFSQQPIQTVVLLFSLLKWPYQTLFIDLANQLWQYMNNRFFEDVLYHIILYYIMKGLHFFNFVQLFQEFWQLSPTTLKEGVKKSREFYAVIEAVLNYNYQRPLKENIKCLENVIRELLSHNEV